MIVKKKIVVLLSALVLILANNFSVLSASAESKVEVMNLEDSIMDVNELINQSENVAKNLVDVDDETKHELVLKLSNKLKGHNKYNVDISHNTNPSDYEILGMVLPNGEVQYSLSYSSVNTNSEGIVNDLELLNFTFTEKLDFSNVYELKGVLDENNIVHSKLWIDNKLVTSFEKNIDGLIKNIETENVGNQIALEQTNENVSIEEQEFSGAGLAKRWSCTQKCVSSKGVSLMVIGVMAGVCIAVCNPVALAGSAGLAGGACYACVNSTGVLGFSTVMNCWDKCPY